MWFWVALIVLIAIDVNLFLTKSTKKDLENKAKQILLQATNDNEIEVHDIEEFKHYYLSNAGIFIGKYKLEYCLVASFIHILSYFISITFLIISIYFESYLITIYALFQIITLYRSGLNPFFATQSEKQNAMRSLLNYKNSYPKDKMWIDDTQDNLNNDNYGYLFENFYNNANRISERYYNM